MMYGPYKIQLFRTLIDNPQILLPGLENGEDDDEMMETDIPTAPSANNNVVEPTQPWNIFTNIEETFGTRSGRIFNPNQEMTERAEVAMIHQEMALMIDGGDEDPKTFQSAWNHPDQMEQAGWREGIRKEFQDMIKRGVWRKTKIASIPSNRRLIGNKWVFKKKKDGRFRARLCALGYSQIPGEDFTDSHSPVVNDVTFRAVLTLMMKNKWDSAVMDITTAFLHGDMEEQVFMKMPQGLDQIEADWDASTDCTELLKTIYGTKQASRQYWKKFMSTMKDEGFESIHTDTCLLKRRDNNGIAIVCVYVDDCFITGDKAAIDATMTDIEKHFETRRLGRMDEYIGCTVKMNQDGSCTLIQPDMIKKIERDFGADVSTERDTTSPMAPQKMVVRPNIDEGEAVLDSDQQTAYRSGVGMMLYLVKHSRPDLCNAVRELAKVMDGATEEHMKMLFRAIKFVLNSRNRGLLMKPNDDEKLVAYVDSDYAGDTDTRRSTTGYIVYFCGAMIAWKSKQQGGVTLSSTEAEYYAISEVATELLFIKQIVEFLDVNLKLPMTARIDNNGAIYLANNSISGSRTKHVDTRVHLVRDLTQSEPKIMETQFVRSEDNQSDTFTKNVATDLFWKHTNKYMTMIVS